ncbi:MAG: hypothetical protein RL357_788, partial [Pseudomonadota bacterium]
WHQVKLPDGLKRDSNKLMAALRGLLEDRVLQDLSQLHFALPKQWVSGESVWVCVCDLSWLESHYRAFEDAGRAVGRIVPELSPALDAQQIYAIGRPQTDPLWLTDRDQGVVPLNLQLLDQGLSWIDLETPIQCEPAWANAIEQRSRRLTLERIGSHWAKALNSGWDLAQFGLQTHSRARAWRQLSAWMDEFRTSRAWRPARWGLLVLVLAQFIGLNAWAWRTQQGWAEQTQAWTAILKNSFPKVQVVIDAPAQMQREVDRLQKGSGQLARSDFEMLLQQMGETWPKGKPTPSQLNYRNGELKWPLSALSASESVGMRDKLTRRGFTLAQHQNDWLLHATELGK